MCSYRAYTGEDRHNLDLLRTTWLVDEFLQDLHSKRDYMDALQHITAVAPSLTEYMKENLVILEGDFPTWKYNKKIVADVSTCITRLCDIQNSTGLQGII